MAEVDSQKTIPMTEYIRVMPLLQLPRGAQQVLSLQGLRVLFCHAESGIYAVEDKCPHVGMPLCGGVIVGDVIRCPTHNATFDLKTGEPTKARNLGAAKTFPVKIENNWIFVGL